MRPPRVDRSLHRTLQIDTNRINSRANLTYMNQLERWHHHGVIRIEMSEIAHNEVLASRSYKMFEKAVRYIFSETLVGTPEEKELMDKIEFVLFPHGAKDSNQRNDVEIAFNAIKYAGGFLVTADGGSKRQPGGFLGRKEELAALGLRVMTDEEAVRELQENIRRRDNRAQMFHEKFGSELPDWIGKDAVA